MPELDWTLFLLFLARKIVIPGAQRGEMGLSQKNPAKSLPLPAGNDLGRKSQNIPDPAASRRI